MIGPFVSQLANMSRLHLVDRLVAMFPTKIIEDVSSYALRLSIKPLKF